MLVAPLCESWFDTWIIIIIMIMIIDTVAVLLYTFVIGAWC